MWNISNILSLSRIFITIPVVYGIINDKIILALIFSLIAMITDYLDGYFARRLNQITELGKILDPAADKVIILFAVTALVYAGRLNLFLAIAIVLRDLLIFGGGFYAQKKLGYVLPSNKLGKWTVTVISVYLILKLVVNKVPELVDISMIILISVLMLLSLIVYFVISKRKISDKQKHSEAVIDNSNK